MDKEPLPDKFFDRADKVTRIVAFGLAAGYLAIVATAFAIGPDNNDPSIPAKEDISDIATKIELMHLG